MPITDYSKIVIYVLKCLDDTITEEYVGSTTNFRTRKSQHKSKCNNNSKKNKTYNCKKYQFIRANGGWDNWIMIQLEEYPCENKRQAECREEEVRLERKATLNSMRVFITAEQRAEQIAKHHKEYYKEHASKTAEYQKKYRKEHAEQLAEYKKEYRKEHAEQIAEYHKKYQKEYYKEHAEQIAEYHKKYRKEHAEQIAEYKKEYQKEYYKKKKEQAKLNQLDIL
jgi:hypothetical protein